MKLCWYLIVWCIYVWQIAQQEAQRAQYVVDKAKQERQQKIVQAEGEAASAKLVSFEYCLDSASSLVFWGFELSFCCRITKDVAPGAVDRPNPFAAR